MKTLSFILAFCLLPVWVWGQYGISGTVSSTRDNAPLAGAAVEIIETHQVMETGEDGMFKFENLPSGTYNLFVQARGHQPFTRILRVKENLELSIRLVRTTGLTDEVIIEALRANDQTATTYSQLSKAEIEKSNFGQDMPMLLNQLPSTVVTSDAGAGIGYTGIRIRGSDPTRINVTINGIALNDAESHNVFWVDLPDLASSVNSLQVQRGVGTSTNGAGAFGASINVQTNTLSYEPYAELNNSFGSFNTFKNTLAVGTGLIKDKFSFDIRLSSIQSDGWVDRAFSNLKSLSATGSYYGKRSLLKAVVMLGQERTYQSWWGVPEARAKNDEQGVEDHIARNYYTEAEAENLRNSDRRYNYYTYDDQTDNYGQDHYQLLYSVDVNEDINLNAALHYTRGKGYYEEYKEDASYSAYGLPDLVLGDTTLSSTDLVRRRWLDNHYYGFTFAAKAKAMENLTLTLGGAWNAYDGDHFGELTWMRFAGNSNIRDRYYESRSLKQDFNTYLKGTYALNEAFSVYLDLQYRYIDYRIGDSTLDNPGLDNDLREIQGNYVYNFFNPKLGLTWQVNEGSQIYASFAVGNREPVRSDFIDAPEGRTPLPETLRDLEAGYRLRADKLRLQTNVYFMDYDNQLVLNGELNDVGAPVRQNVKDSYRLGVEVDAQWDLFPKLTLSGNLTLSQNKIREFDELIYQYDADFNFTGTKTNTFENTDISFSPNLIGSAALSYRPVKGLELSWLSKYVGRQYLDNTGNASRSLDPFFLNDLRAWYRFSTSWAKEVAFGLTVNNLLNAEYAPNGYTYNYEYAGDLIVENFLYPQAGRHFLANLTLKF